jgi:hypothetical protein
VKIVWEQSAYIGNAPVFCTLCGRRSYPIRGRRNQLLLAVIYDPQGIACGEACRDCVAAGPKGIQARVHDRIESFRSKIADLESLGIDHIETPSLEEEFRLHQQDAAS